MMTTTDESPAVSMLSNVESVLRENAAQAEADRRLAPEAMEALFDTGFLRTWVPKAYGGLEMDLLPALRMYEELSRIDTAAGWVTANSSSIAYFCQVLPEEAQVEMFADPRCLMAGGWFPPGSAERADGGYRVTGQWAFSSGCDYATWLTGQALVMENGVPQIKPDGNPVALLVFFRADEAEIVDTWNTLGMRGTGSHDVRIENLFIPDRRCWVIEPLGRPAGAFASSLYGLGIYIPPAFIPTVALGTARAAFDDFMDLVQRKTPSYTQVGLADRPVVQERAARARALIDAGRRNLYAAVGEAQEFIKSAGRIDLDRGINLAMAGAFAIDVACQAVDMIHACAGTTAFRTEHRFQQYFRDVHTLSQHAFATPSGRFESLGKLMLGRESDWPFYYL
jgi:alkylation response protein AidB-like acyl-CoA dehydrogenase